MKTIKNPEAQLLMMKICDAEAKAKLGAEKNLTKEQLQQLDKKALEEPKREIRLEKVGIYQRYQRFKKLMNVYNRYQYTKTSTHLLKSIDPTIILEKFYKDTGLDKEPNIDEEYKQFIKAIEQAQLENPKVDINDITSKDSRSVISDIMNQTQKGKEVLPADLDFVAIIEGYGLYKAIDEIRNGKDKETVMKKNEITEEMLQKAEAKRKEFDEKGTGSVYRRAKVNELALLTAGVLEIAPGEAQRDLECFGEIEPIDKEPITEVCLLVNREEPQIQVIDAFYKKLEHGVPMDYVKEAIEGYLNKIESKNKEQEMQEEKFRRANNGRPSPRFLRELKKYQEEKAKEQEQNQLKKAVGSNAFEER